MSRAWWRSNAVGLGVSAVCVPAVLGVTWWVSTYDGRFGSVEPPVTVVAHDATTSALGYELGPLMVEAAAPTQAEKINGAPEGTKSYLVGVKFSPQADATRISCTGVSLREVDGQQRVLPPANDLVRLNANEEFANGCDPSATRAYTAVFFFVLPEDASTNMRLDVPVIPTDISLQRSNVSFTLELPDSP